MNIILLNCITGRNLSLSGVLIVIFCIVPPTNISVHWMPSLCLILSMDTYLYLLKCYRKLFLCFHLDHWVVLIPCQELEFFYHFSLLCTHEQLVFFSFFFQLERLNISPCLSFYTSLTKTIMLWNDTKRHWSCFSVDVGILIQSRETC